MIEFLAKIPEHGVRNKVLVSLFSVLALIVGGMTLFKMKREAFPTFSFDIVTINTVYPGSSPEEVEKFITQPIEDELKSVSDLKEYSSVSAEGYSLVFVTLDPDAKDKPKIINDIKQAVDRVDDFPSDLDNLPVVTEMRTQDAPVIEVAVSGDLSRKDLQKYAKQLQLLIEDIPEVSSVVKGGWQNEQIWVELDPAKLLAYRMSVTSVSDAIRSRNINIPAGTLKSQPNELLVRTNAEFKTPEEIEQIVVRSNASGQSVKVKDIAHVKYAFQDSSVIFRTDGSEAINLTVVKKEKYDIIKLVDSVQKAVEEYRKNAPPQLKIAYINDISFYVKRRLDILVSNGILGLFLVLLVLFSFISFPIAFWTVVGLPTAAAMGFWVIGLFGININLISMFGLIMVLGILVDDAIVVSENVYRKMEEGLPPDQAAIEGTKEVIAPVAASIFTIVLAFFPLTMMTGIFGKFVYAIPVVVILMIVTSWLECMWVLPSHLTEFPKITQKFLDRAKRKKGEGVFGRLKNVYAWFLKKSLPKHTLITQIFFGFIALGIYIGIKTTPVILFPSDGIEIFFVRAEGKIGTPLSETEKRFIKLEEEIKKLPADEVQNYVTMVGKVENDPNDPFSVHSSHVGQIVVYLTPEMNRKRKAKQIMDGLRSSIEPHKEFERVWLEEVSAGPPQGKPVAVRIRGDSFKTLEEISLKVQEELSKIPGVEDIRDDFEQGKDEIVVRIKEDTASRTKLNAAMVARTLRTAFEGEISTKIREGDEETDVVVRLNEKGRANKEIFNDIFIENALGNLIPLHETIETKPGNGIYAVKHYDGKRSITVTSGIDETKTTSIEANQSLATKLEGLKNQFLGYSFKFGGEYQDTQESMDALKKAFVMAIFLIFIVLAATFKNLSQPFLIMLAIPFALFSAIWALKLHGKPFSFLAMLGMIGLCGVAVNDTIVLIDFLNTKKKELADKLASMKGKLPQLELDQMIQKDTIQAIVEGSRVRLRPLLLICISSVVDLLPLAYGIGGDDPFLRPMALAMSWGLLFGTIFELLLIPNAYMTLNKYPFESIIGLLTPLFCLPLVIFQPMGAIASDIVAGILLFTLPTIVLFIRKTVKNLLFRH